MFACIVRREGAPQWMMICHRDHLRCLETANFTKLKSEMEKSQVRATNAIQRVCLVFVKRDYCARPSLLLYVRHTKEILLFTPNFFQSNNIFFNSSHYSHEISDSARIFRKRTERNLNYSFTHFIMRLISPRRFSSAFSFRYAEIQGLRHPLEISFIRCDLL